MHVAVYIPLLIPALAALAARPLASRLPPPAATWLLAASTLVLALTSSAVLGMLALSALVRVSFVDAVGHMSAAVIRSGDAVSLPVALLAGGLLAAGRHGRGPRALAAGRRDRRRAPPGPHAAGNRPGRGDRGCRRRRLHASPAGPAGS